MLVQESLRSHDESGSAIAALLGVIVPEGFRDGMQFAWRRESFDRQDFLSLGIYREHGTAIHHLPIDDHGAGPARAAVADAFGAGKVQMIAQGIAQRGPRLNVRLVRLSVDVKGDRNRAGSMNRCRYGRLGLLGS